MARLLAFLAVALPSVAAAAGPSTLKQLKEAVDGRLYANTPFSLPCFSTYEGKPVEPDAAACAAVQANWGSPAYRTERPGAYMNYQDSMCSSDPADQCELDNTNPANPQAFEGKNCRQGNVPLHYLQVEQPSDVQAAFAFSKASGTRLVVKNSGHDYLSHSSQRGALALWTRKLQKLAYEKSFVPEGCKKCKARPAITTGAGINCGQAYEFADANDVTILCGYAETVGISGGWVQTGGHSVLSPVYGLGVDRVLEFKVVTPEGKYLVANECQNQDLFWALRGGGGGTFGVVMESTHLVEPAVSMIVADINFPSNATTLLEYLGILLDEAVPWAEAGWGGHITGSSVVHVNPLLTMKEAKKSTKAVADYALSHGGTAKYKKFDSFLPFYQEYILANTVAVGNTHLAGSRLIPRAVLDSKSGRSSILGFLSNLVAGGGSPYVPVSSPALYKRPNSNSTSATPAWYSSLWELGAGGTWAWNSTLAERVAAATALDVQTTALEAVTPGSGAYMNEANPWTADWMEAWWGMENYESLLAIKKRYDPDGLLSCWRCVGWEESDVADSCFKAFNN